MTLQEKLEVATKALYKIMLIENQMYGGDWDEITLARELATEAIREIEQTNNADNVLFKSFPCARACRGCDGAGDCACKCHKAV